MRKPKVLRIMATEMAFITSTKKLTSSVYAAQPTFQLSQQASVCSNLHVNHISTINKTLKREIS